MGTSLCKYQLELFLKASAAHQASFHHTQIETPQCSTPEPFRGLRCHDLLRQIIYYRRRPNAGFTYKDRIITSSPRQHLHDTTCLDFAADNRVKPSLFCNLSEIASPVTQ